MNLTIKNPNKLPLIDYRRVEPLQGNLKDLTQVNHDKLLRVLKDRGFTQPLNLWKRDGRFWLLDGHQRLRVLLENDVNNNGSYEVPYLITEAKNLEEAKRQILEISSQYGTITQEGYDEFTVDLPETELVQTVVFDNLKDMSKASEDLDKVECPTCGSKVRPERVNNGN